MYAVNAIGQGSIVGFALVVRQTADSLLAHARRALRQVVVVRGGIGEATGWVTAGIVIALMVHLAGAGIERSEANARVAVSLTPSVALEIDPRDASVANGPVTPWMERANSTDRWMSPLLPTPGGP